MEVYDQQLLSLYLVIYTTDVKNKKMHHHWKSADIKQNETIYSVF